MKFSQIQVREVFNYIDIDGDGYLMYNDFCELCEEKRRQIDPFEGGGPARNPSSQSSAFSPHADPFISSELANYREKLSKRHVFF